MKLLIILTSFLPRFLQNIILNLMGHKIHRTAKISFGAVVISHKIIMGPKANIGPFSIIYCNKIEMKDFSKIGGLCLIKCGNISLKQYAKISPLAIINSDRTDKAILTLGKHSQIFPFCWIEPGEGVFIGDDTGIGGHTLIFTHGAWSDFLKSGPVKYAPVYIGNHVWLPWRVFIMPGVTINDDSIVAAGSILSSDVEKGSLVAGVPAKKIKDNIIKDLTYKEKIEKANTIINEFKSNSLNKKISVFLETNDTNKEGDILFVIDELDDKILNEIRKKKISILHYKTKEYEKNSKYDDLSFYYFIRKYGIRLSLK